MNNFISIVNHFNLVIYTDTKSVNYVNTQNNPKIKIIIKELDNFYNYKYKDYWITNHEKNYLLNSKSCWELNMIWSEKIQFVKETAKNKYFDTEFYGWCDIGYFRNRPYDLNTKFLSNWCNNKNILISNLNKICYACITNNDAYMNLLHKIVNDRNQKGLPSTPIPPYQNSIAGGFFILHKNNIEWWATTYDNRLRLYFENDYIVKDDQIILVDCILSNIDKFTLFREKNRHFDNWFMFQRILN
jgi:hypothetical protein